ncbi:MAG: hypothetical protein EAZ07_06555 [Cytophagales bacterium]|nr:MAG: hypothetical protein EAZ07_06555 [Cytophagales bacterium]
MKKYTFILIAIIIISINACVTINPYHCPATTDQRYRDMDHRDKKNLTRKPNKYKRREPNYNKQESLGDSFDYKDK